MLKNLILGTLVLTGIVISVVAPADAGGKHKDIEYKPQDGMSKHQQDYGKNDYPSNRLKDHKHLPGAKIEPYGHKSPKNDSWDNGEYDDYKSDKYDPRNRGYEKVEHEDDYYDSQYKGGYKKGTYNKYPNKGSVIFVPVPVIKFPSVITPPWNPNVESPYDYDSYDSGRNSEMKRKKIEKKIKKLYKKLDRLDSDHSGYKGGYDGYDYDRKGGYDSNSYPKPYPTYGGDYMKQQNPLPVIEVKPIKPVVAPHKHDTKKAEVKLSNDKVKVVKTPTKVNPAKKPCK